MCGVFLNLCYVVIEKHIQVMVHGKSLLKICLDVIKRHFIHVYTSQVPTFLCAVTFIQTCFKTSVWCQGSRNPLKVLQFVFSDTCERLRYSDVNLSYFSMCPKTFKTSKF